MIISNQAHCLICDDKPYSAHVHNYVSCKCGNLSVDGGQHYLKRNAKDFSQVREMSIELDDEHVKLIETYAQESIDSGRNALGISFAVLRAVRDCGLLKQGEEE